MLVGFTHHAKPRFVEKVMFKPETKLFFLSRLVSQPWSGIAFPGVLAASSTRTFFPLAQPTDAARSGTHHVPEEVLQSPPFNVLGEKIQLLVLVQDPDELQDIGML